MTTDAQKLERLEVDAETFAAVVSRALKAAIRAGTDALGLTAQGEPAGAIVPIEDLVLIESAWREQLENAVLPELAAYFRAGAEAALADLAQAAPVLLDMRSPIAESYLAQARNRLAGVGTDMWMRTRDQLVSGMQVGESIPELSRRVQSVIASSDTRAQTIARTEVISASNAGALEQVKLMGEAGPVAKGWLATMDARTRSSHAAADGQIVALDGVFNVGGASMEFPGDPAGPPEEVINCRCTIIWYTAEDLQETN